MRSYIISEGSRVEEAHTQRDNVGDLKKWLSADLQAKTYVTHSNTFRLFVYNFIFPLPVYGIPYEYFREIHFSLCPSISRSSSTVV